MNKSLYLKNQPVPIAEKWLHQYWDAQWIAHPTISRSAFGVFHFRRTFELNKKPASFVVHVSADNRYRLFVNGSPVSFGPARGDIRHWRYETLDLAPWLKKGTNVLATIVANFGEHRPWAQESGGSTGFILQANSEEAAVVNTNSNWSVLHNTAYQPRPMHEPETQMQIASTPESVDAENYPWGWELPEFDDSTWAPALPTFPGVPNGVHSGDTPVYLVPRIIPPMEEVEQRLGKIARQTGINSASNEFLQGRQPVTIPPNAAVTLLLDHTFLTMGFPELTVSQGRGSQILIGYAEALYDENRQKQHRDKIDGMEFWAYDDEFRPDGGEQRLFRPLTLRTFRYLQLTIQTADEPLILEDVPHIFSAYPFQKSAKFECNAPELHAIWKTGWDTARLCAGETYFDCPYYEQLQYVGDTRIQALISLYVSGDDRLMRKAIMQFDDSRFHEGLTASRHPSYIFQAIPPYSLYWIDMLYDFWWHRPDTEFVRSFLSSIRGILEWFENRIDPKTGILGPLDWWQFVDWAPEFPMGVPQGAYEGGSSILSLQFAYSLKHAAVLMEAFERPSENLHYTNLANQIVKAVLNTCWDDERGLLANTPKKQQFSQHANTMAVLTGMFPADEAQHVLRKIMADDSLIQCTFYYRFYLHEAIKENGLGNMYLDMLQPWQDMLDMGLTTFSENPEPTRSDCHAWSASPNFDFLSTICGINPAAHGFRQVDIRPALGKLQQIKAQMPHPNGIIALTLQRQGADGVKAHIELPDNISGRFFWHNQEKTLKPGKQTIEFE